jgi:hypothetical protein
VSATDDDAALIPDHGGRVRLLRVAEDGAAATYRVTLATPEGFVVGEASAAPSGVTLRADGAPEWLVTWARALLVTLAKRSVEEGWPRHVVRWREEKK